MRLDKFLSNAKVLTRSEVVTAIKKQQISINDIVATKKDQLVDPTYDEIKFNGKIITLVKYVYFMLNKPQGYVSSTDDPRDKTVLDLLPNEYRKYNLFPCGRLDKDTTGLVILTNNGTASHSLLLPKNHISKQYSFKLAEPISTENLQKIESGIMLRDGYTTKPCKIDMKNSLEGEITIVEGKYHEIKRMFGACGNKIISLNRDTFSTITLDPALKQGEFRPLTSTEIKVFEKYN